MFTHKVDITQNEIVAALRGAGAFVWDCSALGGGFPDLFVVFRGTVFLLECKSPGGRLTPRERYFRATCPLPVHVVRTAEEALRAVGALSDDF